MHTKKERSEKQEKNQEREQFYEVPTIDRGFRQQVDVVIRRSPLTSVKRIFANGVMMMK